MPSALPQHELDTVKSSFQQILIRLGFRTGVYHLEARIQNSDMYYVARNDLMDLCRRPRSSTAEASPFLIEVNARPPGCPHTLATALAYGVDYGAVAMLYAIDDKQRARAASQQFIGGAQAWYEIIIVPATRGGIFESDDLCLELVERHSELEDHMVYSHCFFHWGDRVIDPSSGTLKYVAAMIIRSRKNRLEARELAERARREVRWKVS